MEYCPNCNALLFESFSMEEMCTEYLCFNCGYERYIDESQEEKEDE